jgi:hypothetical protein
VQDVARRVTEYTTPEAATHEAINALTAGAAEHLRVQQRPGALAAANGWTKTEESLPRSSASIRDCNLIAY